MKTAGKLALVSRTSELMPQGKPTFSDIIYYPMISALVKEYGYATMYSALFVLVKDFCSSVNVVRKMDEDQMIEAAAFLLDECGNFRMEDYVMMFTLAKRGHLAINGGKGLMDRVDIEQIGKILDAYWAKRNEAGNRAQEQAFSDSSSQGQRLLAQPVDPEALKQAQDTVDNFIKEFAKSQPDEEQEAIYRQEKIKQRQRDVMLRHDENQQGNPPHQS